MIEYQQERLVDTLEELVPILVTHWDEVEYDTHRITFNPNFEQYLHLEELGMVVLMIARDEGKIVGYMMDIVSENLHYQKLYACNDFYYVHPDQRGGKIFKNMTFYIERILKQLGVYVRSMNIKVSPKTINGYTRTEEVYNKYLGD